MGFINPSTLPLLQPKPGWNGRFFHSDEMTFAYYELEVGASLHAHAHPNEEVWHIVEGELEFMLGAETRRVATGEAVVVPSGMPHAVTVRSRCRAIVVDHPRRHEVGGVKI